MWNPVKISFKNLFSHVDSSYEFNNGRCTVVFGENKTDEGYENNGSGKSALFEAVCIALTNENFRKKEDFINYDAESCTVDFLLENKILKKTLRIVRTFNRGNKPVVVKIYENGVINTQLTSVAEANKRVYDLLGICREDLLRYYIIGQDNRYNFFTASDTEKKEIMNRITSADMIKPLIEELNVKQCDLTEDAEKLKTSIEKFNAKIEALQHQKEIIIDSSDEKNRIKEFEVKIEMLKEKEAEYGKSISSFEESVANLRKSLESITVVDFSQLVEEKKRLKKKIEINADAIYESGGIIKKLKNELESVVKCPECGAEFINDGEFNLSPEEVNSLIEEAEGNIKIYEAKNVKLKKKIEDIEEKINEAEEKLEQYNALKIKISKTENKIIGLNEEISNCKRSIKRNEEQIEQCKNSVSNDDVIKGIDNEIKRISGEIKQKEEELIPIENQINMYKFWLFNLGRNGFTTYLANKSIKIIEGMTNSFLRKFGVEMSVLINGFKILKSGEVREKIEVFVSKDGKTMESFVGKSGGEKGRIILAGILTMNHLINASTDGKGLNLLMFDESFNGIDRIGTMGMIETMDKTGITTMMITQNIEDVSICSNTIHVVKEKGISRIIQ